MKKEDDKQFLRDLKHSEDDAFNGSFRDVKSNHIFEEDDGSIKIEELDVIHKMNIHETKDAVLPGFKNPTAAATATAATKVTTATTNRVKFLEEQTPNYEKTRRRRSLHNYVSDGCISYDLKDDLSIKRAWSSEDFKEEERAPESFLSLDVMETNNAIHNNFENNFFTPNSNRVRTSTGSTTEDHTFVTNSNDGWSSTDENAFYFDDDYTDDAHNQLRMTRLTAADDNLTLSPRSPFPPSSHSSNSNNSVHSSSTNNNNHAHPELNLQNKNIFLPKSTSPKNTSPYFKKASDRYSKDTDVIQNQTKNGTQKTTDIKQKIKKQLRKIDFKNLPLSQVSSWIVRHAPCFWCCFCLADLPESSATDRMILVRLNYLCAIFSILQVGVGIFLLVILFDPAVADRGDDVNYIETLMPNLWTLSGMLLLLSLLGFIIFVTMMTSRKLIREVNLQGAIRYLWVLYWILPLETFFVVSLFDSHSVTEVWVRHWWSTSGMAWFREVFCPRDLAHTKCVVPLKGGRNHKDEEDWCSDLYNQTDCGSIRDVAQKQMFATSYIFFTVNAIWGVCLVLLLLLSLAMLQGIISTPIVQKSKEAKMPEWLTMPTIFSFTAGCILLYAPTSLLSDESESRFYWIGISYMVAAGTFLFTALLGWFISIKTVLNHHDNMIKQIAVNMFIVSISFGIIAVAAIFAASLFYSLNIVSVPLGDEARGAIACDVAATINECSNCPSSNSTLYDPSQPVCPEWAWEEVLRIIQTQLKQSFILGGILLLYALGALRFGFVLRSHINAYEIEYV